MQGLKSMINSAEELQSRINDWPVSWRLRIPDWSVVMRLLHKYNLLTQCKSCGAVQDTSVNPVLCDICSSDNTASEYYC